MSEASTRTLIEDLRAVVAEAEKLIAASADDANERAGDFRHHASESIGKARAKLEELEVDVAARAKAAAEQAASYVRDNPLQSVGIAAAVGIVVGLMLGRR
jgi:ElaB/YqjD/DUF883 family membrane-anchored ribosome-binding protein